MIIYRLSRANICIELNWIGLDWIGLDWIGLKVKVKAKDLEFKAKTKATDLRISP